MTKVPSESRRPPPRQNVMRHVVIILAITIASIAGCGTTPPSAQPPTTRLARVPRPATHPGEILETTVTDLGNFDFDPMNPVIPPDVQALDGVRVRLHGMLFQWTDELFILVPTDTPLVAVHCSMLPARCDVQRMVMVHCHESLGKSVPYQDGSEEATVEGILHVRPKTAPIAVTSIFQVDLRNFTLEPKPGVAAGPTTAAADRYQSIAELNDFPFDPDNPTIPPRVLAMNGTAVRLVGFMVPTDSRNQFARFALVHTLYHPDPDGSSQIQKAVVANCPEGKSVSYFPDLLLAQGILKVGPFREDGEITHLFELELTSLKPLQP